GSGATPRRRGVGQLLADPRPAHAIRRNEGIGAGPGGRPRRLALLHRAEERLREAMTTGIVAARAPDPVGHFPHARKVGNLLFLSGIGPRKKGTKEIPGVRLASDGSVASHDIEAQCRSVFENGRAVLEES